MNSQAYRLRGMHAADLVSAHPAGHGWHLQDHTSCAEFWPVDGNELVVVYPKNRLLTRFSIHRAPVGYRDSTLSLHQSNFHIRASDCKPVDDSKVLLNYMSLVRLISREK